MRRYGIILVIVSIALLGMACSSEVDEGTGTLPNGMESDLVPDADLAGYLYFQSDTPINVPASRFLSSDEAEILAEGTPDSMALSKASIVISTPEQFGGMLEFASEADAQTAHSLYGQKAIDEAIWTSLTGDTVDVVTGDTLWTANVRSQFESGNLVPLKENNPEAWGLLTHLPVSPTDPPLAAGVISLDGDLLQKVARSGGLRLFGLNTAFSIVRVHNLAFAVYGRAPDEIPEEFDVQFLNDHDTGTVLVSKAGYPGIAVAFLLRTVAGRLGLETIELGDTNARYREVEDGHLILKNKGSLVYAVVAGTRAQAEELMLRALAD